MDKFGLSEKTIETICRFFDTENRIEEVKIFGSRARGNFKPSSDIDLTLYGDIDEKLLRHINSELDELPTPYKFDVVNYQSIDNENLKDIIDKTSQEFFKR